ncbi:MAG: hypothetical protein AAF491_12360, partial [Verrucomicrobiota bacterium]
ELPAWPKTLRAEAVGWTRKHELIITAEGDTDYVFKLPEMKWELFARHRMPEVYADFLPPLQPITFDTIPGIKFSEAKGKSIRILYDSRGILHLHYTGEKTDQGVSILLLEGATAAWCEDQGIFSLREPLLPAGYEKANASRVQSLQSRLRSLFNFSKES